MSERDKMIAKARKWHKARIREVEGNLSDHWMLATSYGDTPGLNAAVVRQQERDRLTDTSALLADFALQAERDLRDALVAELEAERTAFDKGAYATDQCCVGIDRCIEIVREAK